MTIQVDITLQIQITSHNRQAFQIYIICFHCEVKILFFGHSTAKHNLSRECFNQNITQTNLTIVIIIFTLHFIQKETLDATIIKMNLSHYSGITYTTFNADKIVHVASQFNLRCYQFHNRFSTHTNSF